MIKTIASFLSENDIRSIPNTTPDKGLSAGTIQDVLHVVFGFAGAIALIVISRAAFKYVASQGEPQEVKKQKDAILYAVAGLILSIIAFSVVNFVVEWVK